MLYGEMTTGSSSSREENRFKVWHDGGDWFKKIVVKSGWFLVGSEKLTFFFSLLTFTHLQPLADSKSVVCGLFLHRCQILPALPK